MKHHNKHYKTFAFALLLAILMGFTFSCKKALENKLTNDTYADTYWKSAGDVNGALLGAYGLFRKSMNQNSCFFIWGDAPVGLFNSDEGTNLNRVYLEGFFGVPYREEGAHNWTNWYRVVDLSNLVIEHLTKMPDDKFTNDQKNTFLGEAYFLRALSYFYMTRVWGDLPLQLTATTTAGQAKYIGRTDAAIILKQIIADAQKASSLLSWESLNTYERRRASKGAALALLAHATAWQNDYANTVLYTDSLINRADLFHLQPMGSIRQVFKNTTEPENIFVISSKNSENEASEWTDFSFSATIAFITVSNGYIANMPMNVPQYYPPQSKINELYGTDNTDSRKDEFFKASPFGDVNKPSLIKYADIAYQNPSTKSDPRSESNLIVFRLADMILLKAEALNALARDGEALVAVNTIRARAGAAPLASSGLILKKNILQERQRELIGEGHNYFDIVRNSSQIDKGGPNYFTQLTPWAMSVDRFKQKGYLWPIHNSILNANRLISQNPWWMGKY
ncbi:RagB/SusD family nutrient uptake outer membrane protein [Mucilaginibacter sp. RCC_168]|uniref:RagB/SusD family nutrient uptake outer membrane protein n=1 Tax=Mucilaginibacter sp. RCC_168 TaxID=3239221 RepID=UPI0035269EA6